MKRHKSFYTASVDSGCLTGRNGRGIKRKISHHKIAACPVTATPAPKRSPRRKIPGPAICGAGPPSPYERSGKGGGEGEGEGEGARTLGAGHLSQACCSALNIDNAVPDEQTTGPPRPGV